MPVEDRRSQCEGAHNDIQYWQTLVENPWQPDPPVRDLAQLVTEVVGGSWMIGVALDDLDGLLLMHALGRSLIVVATT